MKRVVMELDAKTLDILYLVGEKYNMTVSEAARALVALVVNIADEECRKDRESRKSEEGNNNA